jgi:hypothetical protein
MIFPSLKDKTKIFQEESQKKDLQKSANNSMYVKRAELDRIVEEETRKRQGNHNTAQNFHSMFWI